MSKSVDESRPESLGETGEAPSSNGRHLLNRQKLQLGEMPQSGERELFEIDQTIFAVCLGFLNNSNLHLEFRTRRPANHGYLRREIHYHNAVRREAYRRHA